MAKTITKAQRTGKLGELIVEETVTSLGLTYHPSGDLEVGTDGFIEVCDQATGSPSGQYIGVQIKATTTSHLAYWAAAKDVDYWKRQNIPFVLLRVLEPERLVLWKFIDSGAAPGTIAFSRTDDVLDATAVSKLVLLVGVWRWIDQLRASEQKSRVHAATVLGEQGPKAALAVPSLCSCLNDEDREVRSAAAVALGLIRETTQLVALSLLRSSLDPEFRVAHESIESLRRLGEPLRTHFLMAMNGADMRLRLRAAELGVRLGLERVSGTRVLAAFLSPKRKTALRRRAAYCLRSSCIDHRAAISNALPAIIGALDDKDDSVREDCAWAIGIIGGAARGAGDALLPLLADDEPGVRIGTAMALGRIGYATTESLSGLIRLLKEDKEHYSVRTEAAEAIGILFRGNDHATAALCSALTAESASVRASAAKALRHSEGNTITRDSLLGALTDVVAYVRKEAATTLGVVGSSDPSVADALIRALDDEYSVSAEAAIALGNIGAAAMLALPKLRALPTTGSWGFPSVFQTAIARIEAALVNNE